jgi:quercetin dioxygenase-like cupin family protein
MSTSPYPTATSGSDERESRPLMDRLLVFSLAEEIQSLRNEPQWAENEVNSRTLAKADDFRTVLSVLHTDAALDERQGDARTSIHVIEGSAELAVDEGSRTLDAGDLAVVDAGYPWTLRATHDCAVLLTIAWPAEKTGV